MVTRPGEPQPSARRVATVGSRPEIRRHYGVAVSSSPVRPLVIVSNRGPLSFGLDLDGELQVRRGGGGLVTALGPAVAGTGALWVAAAISTADRRAAAEGGGITEAEGFRLRSLVVDLDRYRAYYDVIANGTCLLYTSPSPRDS